MTQDEQLQIIRRGTTEIIGESDILERIKAGRTLRVKLGVDPTAKDVTLGWAVVLRKLRDFQKLGHIACLIIGDFTAQIGDPSGKSKTRKQLTREEVQANVDAVSKQFFRILDPERTEIYYNKDWLGKMSFEDVIRLCSRYTVARIMERDDFTKRFENHEPIAMHEILYPLCQGMDSVEIKSDIEIGGNDQKFNNLVGRTLMEQYGLEPQAVVLCPLLVGTDGKEKMSQSLGNYISVTDEPNTMFGKTMSIPDETIANWFELCTDVPLSEVAEMMGPGKNPRDAKIRLAKEIVALYHSSEAADEAERYFIETFSQRKVVTDAEEAEIPADLVIEGFVSLPALIAALGLAESNGKAKSLIGAGAVALDGEKVSDLRIGMDALVGCVLKVGKHQFRKLV
ncbi:MAG: tyrosine--tRNA ligase [Armatimonadetes bacterium]|nr:tyrosine--tRNA ligase [Armatimonadota bacterium]MBS1727903.1 tyrosine--tRNA ligase [Armatimonadota bacterium]